MSELIVSTILPALINKEPLYLSNGQEVEIIDYLLTNKTYHQVIYCFDKEIFTCNTNGEHETTKDNRIKILFTKMQLNQLINV